MKSVSDKLISVVNQFQRATDRRGEILHIAVNDVVRDSAIKRFELAFDLSWKVIKAYLENEVIACYSPKGCYREAYRVGLITHDDFWLQLVDMRNKSTHIYNESVAETIYSELPRVVEHFQVLLVNLKNKI